MFSTFAAFSGLAFFLGLRTTGFAIVVLSFLMRARGFVPRDGFQNYGACRPAASPDDGADLLDQQGGPSYLGPAPEPPPCWPPPAGWPPPEPPLQPPPC